ncbi:coxsackievirus and adenovirus receptor homolog [Myripristis murdjan]|uniref:coxsackievirus and adenovirus receptor homolog n=1 Tax=Myripristis murdjan TaxID=586833 RepID=UPI0011760565|nr:coxsackievirus and adenovirus receptor homolog [Myripristis murdjan]
MASLSAASLLALSSLICHLAASSEALNLKAQPGENVTLSCQAPDGVDIEAVDWSRKDMKKLECVFFFQDRHIDAGHQHESFKNRVELKDREMKNGDLSVILKNVKKNDSGTYECRFKAAGAKRRKRAIIKAPPISIMTLEVVDPDTSGGDKMIQDPVDDHDPDEPAGRVHPAVAVVPVLAVLIVVLSAVAVLLYRKQKASREYREVNREIAGGPQLKAGVCQEC